MMIDIYFNDLKKDVQQEVLEAAGVNAPKDMNWDVFPLTTIEVGESNKEALLD